MDISIGRLIITEFCETNIEHLKFKRELLADGLMNYFFPNLHGDNFLVPSVLEEKPKIRNFYLVKDIEKLIGWIYIGGIERNIVLNGGIYPQCRKQGYLTKLVTELSDYLFENDLVDDIEVAIKNNNTGALKTIKKANYKRLGKIDSYYIYHTNRELRK